MDVGQKLMRFKMELLRKMPFYGDVLMQVPIVENSDIPTACTNGRQIEYNPAFLSRMTDGQRNYVFMHEVFHIMLFHCRRHQNRDHQIWNTAADMIVNHFLDNLANDMRRRNIAFGRPEDGIFEKIEFTDTVETLYQKLFEINKSWIEKNSEKNRTTILIPDDGFQSGSSSNKLKEIKAPDDIVMPKAGEAEIAVGENGENESDRINEILILQIISNAAAKNRSSFGSYYIPDQLFALTNSKKISWQTLLKNFLTEQESDEASYATPERKYLHMDLILPGHSLSDEALEEVWAFVDSSGSISHDQMEQFLTQLYRISKEFKCVFNIVFWDTQVTEVYTKVLTEKDVLNCIPKHFGGTNIDCVYEWIRNNRIKPDVMLVLTDGYFGTLNPSLYSPSLAKKTILVLSGDIRETDDMKKIGKITRLE